MKNIIIVFLLFCSLTSFSQQLIGTSDNLNTIPGNAKITGTGGLGIPAGTTAQRSGAYTGQVRWNSDSTRLEIYNGSAWRGLLYNGEGGSGGGSVAIGSSITSATAKSVLYAGASGVLAQDNSAFAYDYTNHRLGVGNNAPSNSLHVYTTTSADGISIDGTTFPSLILRISGTIKGYAPAIVTGSAGFFLSTVAGDLAFRSESNKIHFGVTGGNTPTMTIASATGVGFGNVSPDASAYVDITGTAKGFLMPRMTNTQRDAISSPAAGLKVYSTTLNTENTHNGTNWTNAIAVSSAGTLTLTHGNDFVFTGTTTTWTLPAVSASLLGKQNGIKIKNRGSGSITLNSNAGSTLYTTSAQSTITIVAGAACELMPDGTYFLVMYNL